MLKLSDYFCSMRKSSIWVLGLIMALSFMSLLYLQVVYVEEMIKTRREQFDSAVRSSLDMVAKDVEYNETLKWLQEEFNEKERSVLADNDTPFKQTLFSIDDTVVDYNKNKEKTQFELKRSKVDPKDLPKALVAPYSSGGIIPKTNEEIRKEIRQVYLYQRTILEEVVWKIIYKVRNKSVEDRVEYDQLNSSIRYNLYRNGITLPYYFIVVNRNGREVYSCDEFDFRGNEDAYTQELFREGQSHKKILLKIHFPDKKDYIFSSIDFMIPSLIFTMVLLLTFIFTIYIIFRQKKLSEMKSDFVNNMTHEFKTPISTISLAAQMLQDPSVAKSPAMFQHISGVINDETKRLRFQVEKVLQMSMFDRDKTIMKMKELEANAMIAGVAKTFKIKVESYNGMLETNLCEQQCWIWADEMHITNVVFNLMDNAVKYKKEDEKLLLKVMTKVENDKLIIIIEDNGIGVKKEDLKKIFDKFYRVHTGNRHDVKGFGLGLAYVRKIITDHKGTIKAESELNVGTRFIISLPLLKHN